jgi:hypothetical protein
MYSNPQDFFLKTFSFPLIMKSNPPEKNLITYILFMNSINILQIRIANIKCTTILYKIFYKDLFKNSALYLGKF